MLSLPRPRLLALTVLAVLLAACTPGVDAPLRSVSEPPAAAATDPPAIPTATEPDDGPDEVAAEPPSRPDPGDVVLVHLEGPTTDVTATDVVVRTGDGLEIDRFRLAGAVEVHAAPDARHALIGTNEGRWARYDAAGGVLAILTFDGPAPAGPPRVVGPVVWWPDPASAWVARLDTGVTMPLAPLVDEDPPVVQATADGSHLLVRGAGDHVVTTAEGTSRPLPVQTAVTLAADGAGLASTAPGVVGTDVYVEALDGSDRRLVGTVSGEGLPMLLPDGRVVVVGPDSALIGTDGSQADLPAVAGTIECDVAGDGLRLLCATAAQLVVVDVAAVAITPVPNSAGMALAPDQSPAEVLWAATAAPAETGAVAVEMATGAVTPLLPDVGTGAIVGLSADRRTALVRVGSDGADVAVIDTDGRSQVTTAAPAAALHPDGMTVALALLEGTGRTLRIDGGGPSVEVSTGRMPAFLLTTAPDVAEG